MINILDASALMAFIKKEEGWKPVYNLLKKETSPSQKSSQKMTTAMHQINFIEFTNGMLRHVPEQKVKRAIVEITENSPVEIVHFLDQEMGFHAAYLKAKHTLSLGDAVGLAWTRRCGGTFWTADKALENIALEESIALHLIR